MVISGKIVKTWNLLPSVRNRFPIFTSVFFSKLTLLGRNHTALALWFCLLFKSYDIIINSIPHPVHFIPVTHLSCNWKLRSSQSPSPISLIPCHPSLWQPQVCVLYLWVHFWVFFVFLDSTCKWNHTVFVFLSLTYFTWHNALEFHPYCPKWQENLLFYGWIIFHCTYIPHLLIDSCLDEHLAYFHILAIINKTAMNMRVLVSFQVSLFIFFG